MAFAPPVALRALARVDSVARSSCTVRRARRWLLCAGGDVYGQGWLDSPGSVARAWQVARRTAGQTDLGRRH
eukprot:IDg9999t1